MNTLSILILLGGFLLVGYFGSLIYLEKEYRWMLAVGAWMIAFHLWLYDGREWQLYAFWLMCIALVATARCIFPKLP